MANSAESGLRLVLLLGRPVAALPAGAAHSAARRALVGQYPAITWRRSLVRRRLALAARFPSTGRTPTAPDLGLDVERLRDQIEGNLGRSVDSMGIIWPANPRRLRRYVYAFDARGAVITFAKAALGSSDQLALEREAMALEALEGRWGPGVRVPRLIGRLRVGEVPILLQEPLPDACGPTTQAQRLTIATHRKAGRRITLAQLLETRWWADFASAQHSGEFRNQLTELLEEVDTVAVGFVHGDLSPANALSADDVVWLTDFEDSCDAAPAYTDLAGALLSAAPRGVLADPDRSVAMLITAVAEAGGNELDAMLTVAHRMSSGMRDAWVLAQHWPSG